MVITAIYKFTQLLHTPSDSKTMPNSNKNKRLLLVSSI